MPLNARNLAHFWPVLLFGVAPFGVAIAMSARSTQGAAPLSCEITARKVAPHLELIARVQSDRPLRGRYRFTVVSSGSGGTSSNTQGGNFVIRSGEAQVLSQAYVSSGPGGVASARLEVEAEDGSTCSAEN